LFLFPFRCCQFKEYYNGIPFNPPLSIDPTIYFVFKSYEILTTVLNKELGKTADGDCISTGFCAK
jgi:hypothetical protein|tara:strand:+ start:121 stop:315 length:195 start_codon:yes stop_codon:yes gene_type:complete